MKLLFKILLLLITTVIIAGGCVRYSTNDIVDIQEIGCELSEEEEKFVYSIFHYELNFYRSIFTEKIPIVNLKIFGDSLEYCQYQQKISSSKSKNGFYSGSKNMILVYKNDRFLKTVSHEINHFILRNFIPVIPKWVNEGLSENFEFAALENGQIKIQKQSKKVNRLKKWIHESDKIDLEDFLDWSNNKWREVNARPNFYSSTLSWGLVYFFQNDILRKNILKDIIREFHKGEDSINAVNEYYPGGIEQLKIDFFVFADLKL